MRYPFDFHPCWAKDRRHLWERIHLPVAPKCNAKCFFCDHNVGASCHFPKPGRANRVMTVDEAITVLKRELSSRPNLRIVAVSGPGEPLYNPEFYELMKAVKEIDAELKLCTSTNGILLHNAIESLLDLGISTVSISVHTLSIDTAQSIYEWAIIDGVRLSGVEMAHELIRKQRQGISAAVDSGIHVKVNTILIPGVNNDQMAHIASELSGMGVRLQNIVPLVPLGNCTPGRPTHDELMAARLSASHHIKQFYHCKQCRSDVVGIPGNDVIL